jgi:metal-responsive CopG/Arc/MetJ family transcriptional regulator
MESRSELIGQAKREAEAIVRKAQEDADRLVTQQAIYEEAKRKCAEMVAQTKDQITNLRKVSNDYMDDALRRTEEAIALSLEDVRDTRAKFMALVEAQEKRAALQDVEV